MVTVALLAVMTENKRLGCGVSLHPRTPPAAPGRPNSCPRLLRRCPQIGEGREQDPDFADAHVPPGQEPRRHPQPHRQQGVPARPQGAGAPPLPRGGRPNLPVLAEGGELHPGHHVPHLSLRGEGGEHRPGPEGRGGAPHRRHEGGNEILFRLPAEAVREGEPSKSLFQGEGFVFPTAWAASQRGSNACPWPTETFWVGVFGHDRGQRTFAISLQVPQLMDVVVSRGAPLASLTFSGRVIVFPEFEMESMPKKTPQEHSKEKKEGAFPLLGQAGGRKAAAGSLRRDGKLTPGKGLGLPSLAPTGSTEEAALKGEAQKAGKAPLRLPAIPGTPRKAEKSSPKGKTGQAKTPGASRQRAGRGAGMFPPCVGENPAAKKPPRPPGPTELSFPVISVSSPASSEASLPEEPPYNVYRLQPPGKEGAERLKNRPETFWTVLKEPQKKALSVNGTNSTRPVAPAPRKPVSAQPKPPKTGPGLSVLWPRPP
ncbi:uncharacterized protein [Anas platyrhynchos]|uniref:uncharacterized protein isoform X2 n=1 Tax=Anas platyrhynchos TaxID=8839 RepID=UPI003AF2F37D